MYEDQAIPRVRLSTGVTLPGVVRGASSGTVVLLLHAWGESRHSFDRLLPLLPPELRVFAMDQRGHGEADKPAAGYLLQDFADDIPAFMNEHGISTAVLVGSSSGGYVAQQVAVSMPERVAGLLLIGAPRTLPGKPSFAEEVDRLTDPIDPTWVREFLTWFPRFQRVPKWYIDDRVHDGLRMPAHVWREALKGLLTAEPPTRMGTITTPTLIVWGDRDELLSYEDEQALTAAIPGSRLLIYENSGHLILWEQPERVASDLMAFVRTLER
ncbi:MAG: alpha/beta hydrolase [Microbacteriaceae bacterium]|nr:MAG: alpha/beta hydrolase [Microbacteriaceae bacterium]